MINEFIKSELKRYIEPERRGVQKGDPIGFGKNKFHACLLTALPKKPDLKWSAEESGSNYGSLCVWRTQRDYKDKEKEIQQKFVEVFVKEYRGYLDIPSAEKHRELVKTLSELNDDLIDQIFKAVPEGIRYFLNILIKIAERSRSDDLRLPKNGLEKMSKILEGPDSKERRVLISVFKGSTKE